MQTQVNGSNIKKTCDTYESDLVMKVGCALTLDWATRTRLRNTMMVEQMVPAGVGGKKKSIALCMQDARTERPKQEK